MLRSYRIQENYRELRVFYWKLAEYIGHCRRRSVLVYNIAEIQGTVDNYIRAWARSGSPIPPFLPWALASISNDAVKYASHCIS